MMTEEKKMSKFISRVLVVVLSGWVALTTTSAHAYLVSYEFGGTLRNTPVLNTGLISSDDVGYEDRWTGTFGYNTESINKGTGEFPVLANYFAEDAFITMDLTQPHSTSSIVIGFTGGGQLSVYNDYHPEISWGDGFLINANDNISSSVGHTFGGQAQWLFRDSSAEAFNSLEIPTNLNILDFDARHLNISVCAGAGPEVACDSFAAEMDSLVQISAVPAPTTLALFTIGLAGLGWSRRRTSTASS